MNNEWITDRKPTRDDGLTVYDRNGSLSERIRPGCEAAPWVCDEVQNLEATNAELLEALEWLVTIQSIVSIPEAMHSRTYQIAVEQARAAIAKAKGEAP